METTKPASATIRKTFDLLLEEFKLTRNEPSKVFSPEFKEKFNKVFEEVKTFQEANELESWTPFDFPEDRRIKEKKVQLLEKEIEEAQTIKELQEYRRFCVNEIYLLGIYERRFDTLSTLYNKKAII